MAADSSWVSLPIIHGTILMFLIVPSIAYGVLTSETILGVLLAVNLYLAYLVYRVVVAVERIAYEG
ncbi:hypothetical protein [Natrinema salifodinae]|uniref:Uncharacterized protein n=1 Tax=Natrinema salifodinae TaxID=1202768 RepID=A0A1I0M639_9EURY|nr:hypothetical protein [Natrinema salifodinae]SEV83813.1 hypothetical protein SAMN05216285_0535 [Natrinema salifodinae]